MPKPDELGGFPAGLAAGIKIIGLGVNELQDVPSGSVQILKACDVVAYLGQSNEMAGMLRRDCQKFFDLRLHYRDGEKLDDIYDRISTEVIGYFRDNTVAFATNGNPLFLNKISERISRHCCDEDIPVDIRTANSSLDEIIALVGLSSSSFVVATEQRLLGDPSILLGNLDTLVFQMGTWSDGTLVSNAGENTDNFKSLVKQLKTNLEPTQKWTFVSLAVEANENHYIWTGLISNVQKLAKVNKSGTLVLHRR